VVLEELPPRVGHDLGANRVIQQDGLFVEEQRIKLHLDRDVVGHLRADLFGQREAEGVVEAHDIGEVLAFGEAPHSPIFRLVNGHPRLAAIESSEITCP
jgi:hypothetical protein